MRSSKQLKFVIYPNPRFKSDNPYVLDMCNAFEALNSDEKSCPNILNLLKHLFDGDVYIFNWPENVAFRKLGFVQFLLFLLCFLIIKIRKTTVVWVFHNIEPHQGHNIFSSTIFKIFLKYSDVIVPHSKIGTNFLSNKTKSNIVYLPHPFRTSLPKENNVKKEYDIIIWGSIIKYKGILEFLKYKCTHTRYNTIKVIVIGRCKDKEYEQLILDNLDANTTFINKFTEKEELDSLIMSSRFVVFPYLKDSVSSSGALIDSLSLGSCVIGPNVGAFKDMSEEGLCYTFETYDDIFNLVENNTPIDRNKLLRFIESNSWDMFAKNICNVINKK